MDLASLLEGLPVTADPNVLVGVETADDAGVFRLDDGLALVQTLDFITPVCDDPWTFGRIAAANSLSDVYAMGGRPLTALNICCFPADGVPGGVYQRILAGAIATLDEAGVRLLGGHTVRDAELKFGLSVTGSVDPSRLLRNSTARPGDRLVLTKPLGTGVLIGASRQGLAPEDHFTRALAGMCRLNRAASEAAVASEASACTDVTGFALAGHALGMARASGVGMRLDAESLPVYAGSLELIGQGHRGSFMRSNRDLAGDSISFHDSVPESLRWLVFDPQTSGGLLVSVPAARAEELLGRLAAAGDRDARIVGEVVAPGRPRIQIGPLTPS